MAKTFLTKKNNAKSTLASGITGGATSLTVQTGEGANFPSAPFHATLYSDDSADGEIVKVTAISTDTFTIERAKEGTGAQAWSADDKVELLVTAQLFDDFQTRTEVIVATDGSGDYNTDGSSDDDEINEAISDLPAGGGIVRLKKGTYTIDGIIEILKDNVVLEGEGPATIIKAADSSELDRLISVGDGGASARFNIVIQNLLVDGNGGNQSSGNSSPIVIYGASGAIHKRIIVENCHLIDAKLDCLKMLYSEECVIKNNIVHDNTGAGIGIFSSSQYNTIHDNVTYNNGYGIYESGGNYNSFTGNISRDDGYGLYMSTAWRCSISGNVIYSPSNYGIYLVGTQRMSVTGNHVYGGSWGILVGNSSSATKYNSITGNTCAWQSTVGIALYGGSGGTPYNTVSGNAIYGPGSEGIYIYRASYNTINGNVVEGASRTTNNAKDSIHLNDDATTYSTYNIITGNNCQAAQSNKARYHIRENSAGDDFNLIISNICKDGVTGQISLQGSNSVRGTNIPASG